MDGITSSVHFCIASPACVLLSEHFGESGQVHRLVKMSSMISKSSVRIEVSNMSFKGVSHGSPTKWALDGLKQH